LANDIGATRTNRIPGCLILDLGLHVMEHGVHHSLIGMGLAPAAGFRPAKVTIVKYITTTRPTRRYGRMAAQFAASVHLERRRTHAIRPTKVACSAERDQAADIARESWSILESRVLHRCLAMMYYRARHTADSYMQTHVYEYVVPIYVSQGQPAAPLETQGT
jgi:hypothetical protein